MRYVVAFLFAIWSNAAAADYLMGGYDQAQTRFGLLQVVGPRGFQRVLFNGSDLGIENHSFSIDGVWAVQGGGQDWAVLSSIHGGNMCGGGAQVAIMLTAGAAVRTDEFGVCRGRPIDVRVTPDALELDISDPAPRVAYQTFRFDGAQLSQVAVAEATAPAAGAGQAVTRWLGQHPQHLTQDPSEQTRFARVLTPQNMDELNRRMSGPGDTKQEGGWVVGRACQAHMCNSAAAAWALRISDGAPFAIFYDRGGPIVFAGDQQFADPVIASLLRWRMP
ncbi:hypothetical protein SAMN05444273_103433 [Litoreibacter ascidiaceicola]|uniref:Uncharacterized protein n=1 Tax=Litoreibacter ascidiaceicola TaxID=1486859 RepID=A0A1M4Y601_9RHOB|nr:hypothetical protein [Litoreibacter ascidiaceicola]SHF01234.1 hypothetical protein SAMN05444273_103433 [Litoreibacter ascidiaceicola]